VSFVCLQHATTPDETRADLGNLALHHLRIEDFVDLAAAISGLHLVITVDTAVAHLAGALGVPTWVMLPFPADWRWLRDRTDSVWYPGVMRLFRQRRAGVWEGVIEEMTTALLDLEIS
jgi:ADP-heptose:LPS heptosyltransferase